MTSDPRIFGDLSMNGPFRSPTDADSPASGGHLSEDQLNLLIDGERDLAATAHLASCPTCQQEYDDLVTLRDLLRSLPQARTPRSFQLTPEMAGQKAAARGFSAWLLNALPALRAMTVVLALAFGSVIAYDIVSKSPESGQQFTDQAAAPIASVTSTTVALAPTEPAPTATFVSMQKVPGDQADESAPTSLEQDATESSNSSGGAAADTAPAPTDAPDVDGEAPMASEAYEEATEERSSDNASDAAGDTAMVSMAAASPEATATVTPTATATATATSPSTATPEPTATATPAPQSTADENGGFDIWNFVAAVLGLLLAICVAMLLFAIRARHRTNT